MGVVVVGDYICWLGDIGWEWVKWMVEVLIYFGLVFVDLKEYVYLVS